MTKTVDNLWKSTLLFRLTKSRPQRSWMAWYSEKRVFDVPIMAEKGHVFCLFALILA
jgi:hypothetical protein